MGKDTRVFSIIMIALLFTVSFGESVSAMPWYFGTSGQGENQFMPRGFFVDTGKQKTWLGSDYDNTGEDIRYIGGGKPLFIDATKKDGSDYTFYAVTERNPTPGKEYLSVAVNDSKIVDLGPYTGIPKRDDIISVKTKAECYAIPIEGFKLEPGTSYQFYYRRGMTARNGVTMVLLKGETPGLHVGYIKRDSENNYYLPPNEQALYDAEKNQEYRFVRDITLKNEKTKEYKVDFTDMRFTVQTFADVSEWESEKNVVEKFLNSVKKEDYKNGKYIEANVKNLNSILKSQINEIEKVRMERQNSADKKIKDMIARLKDAYNKAKSEKPEVSDISKLEAKIIEAKKLYSKVSKNIGIEKGQYGRLEVEDLDYEIKKGEEMHKHTPQADIDKQVNKIQSAMDAVTTSKVHESQKVFYDKVTGIYVIVPMKALPKNATMSVRQVFKRDSEYKDMYENLPKNMKEAELYAIKFYENEKEVNLKEAAEVQIPIIDSIKQKTSTIYSYSGEELKKIKSSRANGIQIFNSDLKSPVVMAGATATEIDKSKARNSKAASLMGNGNGDRGDRSDSILTNSTKKKEVFQDPVNKLLTKNENLATFSNDVKIKTNPMYLIIFAAALALVAITLGINAMRRARRNLRPKH